MMVLFVQAARVALVVFDPFLSSRPLAEAILRSPDGQIILDRHYYAFSSVAFYTNRPALLLNGRVLNLSYGSYAPGAPDVFIDDPQLKNLWQTSTTVLPGRQRSCHASPGKTYWAGKTERRGAEWRQVCAHQHSASWARMYRALGFWDRVNCSPKSTPGIDPGEVPATSRASPYSS